MPKVTQKKQLSDSYRFAGFRPSAMVSGVFGDRHARVIRLTRRSKKRPAEFVGSLAAVGTIASRARSAICRAEGRVSISNSIVAAWIVGVARA
jgi:hypothetical protein